MRVQVPFRCWLSGHEDFVRFVPGRLYLECFECGRETPGWRIGKSSRSCGVSVDERGRGAGNLQFASTSTVTGALKAA